MYKFFSLLLPKSLIIRLNIKSFIMGFSIFFINMRIECSIETGQHIHMYAKNFPEYITRDYISLYGVLSYRNLATWKIGSSFEYNGRATFFARCKT